MICGTKGLVMNGIRDHGIFMNQTSHKKSHDHQFFLMGFHGRKLADDLAKNPKILPRGFFFGDFLNVFLGFNGILMIQ